MAISGLSNRNIVGAEYDANFSKGGLVLSQSIDSWTILPSRTTCQEFGGIHFSAIPHPASGEFTPSDLVNIFMWTKFRWDFGDAGAGVRSTDGSSRNAMYRGEAGHTYTAAGNYTVTLYVTVDSVETAVDTQAVVVESADTFYSDANTICFSNDTDFTGAPAGSTQVTTSSYNTALTYIGSNKRLLFKDDDIFDIASTVQLGTSVALENTLISNFGAGTERPRFNFTGAAAFFDLGFGASVVNKNNSIANIQLYGTPVDSAAESFFFVVLHNYNEHLTIFNCKSIDTHGTFYGAADELYNQSGLTTTRKGIVLEENYCEHTGGLFRQVGANMHLYFSGLQFSSIGNTFINAGADSHINRYQFAQHLAIRHNKYVHGSSNNRLSIKLHSCTWRGASLDGSPRYEPKYPEGAGISDKWYTGQIAEYATIGENVFDSVTTTQNYAVSVGPQDPWSFEEARGVVISSNYFTGANSFGTIIAECGNIAMVNNVFNGAKWGGYNENPLVVEPSQYLRHTGNIHFNNNTFYITNAATIGTTNEFASILDCNGEYAGPLRAVDNLIYALPKTGAGSDLPHTQFTFPFHSGGTVLTINESGTVLDPGAYPFTGTNPPSDDLAQFELTVAGTAGAAIGDQ